jgi:hypothetical protein
MLETLKATVKKYTFALSMSVTGTLSGEVSYFRNRAVRKLPSDQFDNQGKPSGKFLLRTTGACALAEIAYILLTLAGIVETVARAVIGILSLPLQLINSKNRIFIQLKTALFDGFFVTLDSTAVSGKNIFLNVLTKTTAYVSDACSIQHDSLFDMILEMTDFDANFDIENDPPLSTANKHLNFN